MGIESLLRTPCIIHRVTGHTTDAEGRVTPTVTDVETVCYRQPAPTAQVDAEQTQGTLAAPRRWRLWWPRGTAVAAADTVTVDGDLLSVEGPRELHRSPSGAQAHVAAYCTEVTP